MERWSFLTNHARALLCIAHDPGIRLRDIADALGVTERSAYGIVTDLTEGGYVVKEKDGRRNRYQIQAHLPLREATTQERTIGEILDLLVDTGNGKVANQILAAIRTFRTSPSATFSIPTFKRTTPVVTKR